MSKRYQYIFLSALISFSGCIKYSVQGTIPQFIAVADGGANRILFFNGPITANGPAATFVLGQPDFTSSAANNGGVAIGLNNPLGAYDGQHLLVADRNNNRVLIWNSLPTSNQQQADLVLGQPNFSSNAVNWNGITLKSLNDPQSAFSVGSQLLVGDGNNHRILIWSTFPTQIDQAANISISVPTSTHMGFAYGGGKLFFFDPDNFRVLVWNSMPTLNNQPADFALGQPNTSTNVLNNSPQGGGILSAYGLSGLSFGCTNGSNMVIGDRGNNRALIWKSLPSYNWQPADTVLGQPDFSHNTNNNTPGNPGVVSNQSLSAAMAGLCGLQDLTVFDYGSQRLLFWKSYPTYNQQPADLEVGQHDMVTTLFGVTSQSAFNNFGNAFTNANFSGVYHTGGY